MAMAVSPGTHPRLTSQGSFSTDDLTNGVPFTVRYVGAMEIPASMKSLDFDVRTALAKECIVRVCEEAKYINSKKKARQIDNRVKRLLSDVNLRVTHSGTEDVSLVVSSKALSVCSLQSEERLFHHPMPNISFASGGDDETSGFVCYVGKDVESRRCFVFECGADRAPSVLSTIGQAFALRFQEFQRKPTPFHQPPPPPPRPIPHNPPPLPPTVPSFQPQSPNLINLEAPSPLLTGPTACYTNDSTISKANDSVTFSPVSSTFPEGAELLGRELWYHRDISRLEAEGMLKEDGDFLVRESAQGVALTGLQSGCPKHLLLIDAEGKVRTKDREFHSVSHLIQYHRENNLPITSAESALLLKRPIIRSRHYP